MAQFVVMKVGAGDHIGGQVFSIIDRKDSVKQYYGTQDVAMTKAKEAAALSPGSQFAVFGIVSIFETTKPSFIEKIVNSAGEIVLKPKDEAA